MSFDDEDNHGTREIKIRDGFWIKVTIDKDPQSRESLGSMAIELDNEIMPEIRKAISWVNQRKHHGVKP